MKKLKTSDVFAMSRIVAKMNLKNELKELVEKVQKDKKDTIGNGIELIMLLLGSVSSKEVEKDIYSFIGGVLDIPEVEVAEKDPMELFDELKEAIDMEEWKNFFDSVVRLITRT